METIVLIIIALLVALTSATGPGDTLSKPNHGVVFTPLPQKILTDHSMYDMVFTVPRPPRLDTRLPNCAMQLTSVLADGKSTLQDWCSVFTRHEMAVVAALLADINVGQEGIQSLLHTPADPSSDPRTQRTPLLGFVGGISRSLFGTATTGDVQRVANILNKVVNRINIQVQCV